MSAKLRECVWEHSPYTLGKRLVHLAVAEATAEEHGCYLWASQGYIGRRAKVERGTVVRAFADFVEGGHLEAVAFDALPAPVQAMIPDHRGKLYRVLACAACAAHWGIPGPDDLREIRTGGPDGTCAILPLDLRDSRAEPARLTRSGPITNGKETKRGNSALDAPKKDALSRYAHSLTVLAFEQPVKPTLRENGGGAFPAALCLIERVLRAGTPVTAVEAAIREGVDVWTLAGLQTAVARQKRNGSGRQPLERGGPGLNDQIARLRELERRSK